MTLSVLTILDSVSTSVEWFREHSDEYDLVFMDIRLADGLSFDIFKQVVIGKPIIFVTAYNDYALQAFKNNGIDYILKPFDSGELKKALNKYNGLVNTNSGAKLTQVSQMLEQVGAMVRAYKRSFLVHYRDKLVPVETANISWFFTANEIVYSRTKDDRQYIIEFTMEQLEQQLDPGVFFRANRQFIINRNAIVEVDFYFNGRLSVKISPESPDRILISKARVPEFKAWMNS
jgi:DNA-binding LytR/AlgR family response regulator